MTRKRRDPRGKTTHPRSREEPARANRATPRRFWFLLLLAVSAVAVGLAILVIRGSGGGAPQIADGSARGSGPPAEFVGATACLACHQEEYAAWQGSQHDRAMQVASEETVLGDFDDTRFTYAGVTSTFFRRDGRFMVRTDGPDGQLADFEVAYTFGVDPLQQYLIELPDGRVQPLQVSWDSRPAAAGGQRWFHLYPGDAIEHTDPLHWTGPQQNWNFMCADCHSTNVQKGYDGASNRFETTWSEINVACEACHGPASRHLEWAQGGLARGRGWETKGLTAAFTERREVRWELAPGAATAQRSGGAASQQEVEICAQCHSRRDQIAEGYYAGAPFHDFYQPALLAEGLYHPDGQQLDEVYTYGSFLQSRMFAQGVTCSDCHEPHSAELRAPGNQVCAQCHAPEQFDVSTHHFHPQGSVGAQCASCHMPPSTYMQIDPRRDHSIRVPRPDLSVEIGTPNACTQCHDDRDDSWAAAMVAEWYGGSPAGFQRFGPAFYAHEQSFPGADSALASLIRDPSHPQWVRASALARMAERPGGLARQAVGPGLSSADPVTRRAALAIVESLPPEQRAGLAGPLLDDTTRIVRHQAAWVLAPVARMLSSDRQASFTRAADEFIASLRSMSDRPESRVTLGTFYAMLGRLPEAEAQIRAALTLGPATVPAYVNLADLYRAQGREEEALQILRQGLERVPDDPSLRFALGLARARAGQTDQAVAELARAASLAPESARFTYAYAVALHSTGQRLEAIRVLEDALPRHPLDRDILFALATFHRDEGDLPAALGYAEQLASIYPNDAEIQALIQELSP